MTLEEDFEDCADQARRRLNTIKNEEKLILYGLYKQATVGDVNTRRPIMPKSWNRKRWDSWKVVKGKPQEEAKRDYITKVRGLLSETSHSILRPLYMAREPRGAPGSQRA